MALFSPRDRAVPGSRGKGAEQHKHFSSQGSQQKRGTKKGVPLIFGYLLVSDIIVIYKITMAGAAFGSEKTSSTFRV